MVQSYKLWCFEGSCKLLPFAISRSVANCFHFFEVISFSRAPNILVKLKLCIVHCICSSCTQWTYNWLNSTPEKEVYENDIAIRLDWIIASEIMENWSSVNFPSSRGVNWPFALMCFCFLVPTRPLLEPGLHTLSSRKISPCLSCPRCKVMWLGQGQICHFWFFF